VTRRSDPDGHLKGGVEPAKKRGGGKGDQKKKLSTSESSRPVVASRPE